MEVISHKEEAFECYSACKSVSFSEHRIRRQQLDSQRRVNIAHIARQAIWDFDTPGECRETPNAVE